MFFQNKRSNFSSLLLAAVCQMFFQPFNKPSLKCHLSGNLSQLFIYRKFVSIVIYPKFPKAIFGTSWSASIILVALIRFIFSPSWISYSWQLKTSARLTNSFSFSVQLIFLIPSIILWNILWICVLLFHHLQQILRFSLSPRRRATIVTQNFYYIISCISLFFSSAFYVIPMRLRWNS